MKRVLTTLAAALALAVPALAQVAQIGDTTYADFNSFFTAFQTIAPSETPTTVTLLDDLTGDLAVPGTVPVKEGQAIVFDLNGRTMETALQREGRHYYAIDNYGTLTIKDSSAGQTGTIRARGVQNLGNGKLTIEGGTIVSVDANGGACVWNEADAWVIRNEGDLAAFRDKVNGNVTFVGCTVTLAANLDLAGVAWIPIGEGNAGGASKNGGFFAGTFEGGDHLIANLSVSESKADEGAGLFGWVRGATIRNLSVSGSILSNANGAAGIIGVVESNYDGNLSTTIENVHNVGDTVRGSKAGGIVGDIRRGGTVAITGCTNAAAVTASINHSDQVDALCAGGIVGNAGGTSVAITGCSNSGAVTATPDEEGWTAETPTYAGGIVGRMGTGTLAAGNGDNTGAVSDEGSGTVGQGAILGGMVAGTHPIVELALSQEEAEGGRATLFTGTSLDDASGLEVVPVLPEGMDEPDDFVVTLEDGLFYCDLLYLADRVAGESEGATFDANAQQALLNAAGGSMHGNIAVSGRTGGDKALTTAQVNEALACFEGTGLIVVEGSLEGEKTLVVAYDFGITDVRVTGTGDLVVEVAAQDMSGRPLAFAEGASLSLRNGETALETTQATVEGVTTLTVPAANVPAGELIFKCVSSTHGPREDIVPRGFSYTLCPPKLSPDGTGGADFACGMGGGRGIMVMIFQSKEEP